MIHRLPFTRVSSIRRSAKHSFSFSFSFLWVPLGDTRFPSIFRKACKMSASKFCFLSRSGQYSCISFISPKVFLLVLPRNDRPSILCFIVALVTANTIFLYLRRWPHLTLLRHCLQHTGIEGTISRVPLPWCFEESDDAVQPVIPCSPSACNLRLKMAMGIHYFVPSRQSCQLLPSRRRLPTNVP